MTTISESNPLVTTSETVDTSGIPLEQFTHSHQVDHDEHSTLFVLHDDAGAQDQEVRKYQTTNSSFFVHKHFSQRLYREIRIFMTSD